MWARLKTFEAMDRYRNYTYNLGVGFRVEVHDTQHQSPNNTFRIGDGSMTARDPARGLDNDAFSDHFSWSSRRGGPLISLATGTKQ